MKKSLKTLSLILCVVMAVSLLGACGKKDSGSNVLRVGMECAFAPHNWTQYEENEYSVKMPDGTFVDGYDVQIAKKVADKLGYELEVVKVDWDGMLPSLTSNKIDLIIAGMTDTEERRLSIDFADVYWSSHLYIVTMADGPYANATSLADFAGAKITAQLETLHYDLIDMIPDVKKEMAMADFPTMTVALTSGRIDGYIAERPAAVSAQISNPGITIIEFDEDKGFGEEMPVSIGLRKGEDELKEKINGVLATISVADREKLMDQAVMRQPLQAE
ncbi:MAG: transporter substrate-binding domain-containing protein [Clostridiales bacterium]|nr:transporter substrate-binding domain-containing protein [Clostridiales bacterium]